MSAAIVCGLLLAAGLALYAEFRHRRPDHPLAENEEAFGRLLSAIREQQAFIVWSSNRSGNHDLFLLRLPELEIVRLTEHPHIDYYPRISPDGRRVVFARSQVPQVSQRNKVPWDVYILDLATGRETCVAQNANAPTWAADGRKIFYQRNADSFVEHDLDSGRECVLFESGEGHIPEGISLSYPDFNCAEQKLAVTVRGARRMTAIVGRNGSIERVGGGCTLSWAPGNAYLYLIGHGGKQKNVFYRYNRDTGRSTQWLDLPGDHSHEYFPRVSRCNRYLVFGASTGGHELDVADYELFIWEIGKPPEQAVRLTYHTANDCWPDIYIHEDEAAKFAENS
ncbi:MAG: PD40 domain-containing protein [Lentisphaerae bacterium]|nr:PD40 domain-containing protein [Lentisphaerota bacterium]